MNSLIKLEVVIKLILKTSNKERENKVWINKVDSRHKR